MFFFLVKETPGYIAPTRFLIFAHKRGRGGGASISGGLVADPKGGGGYKWGEGYKWGRGFSYI